MPPKSSFLPSVATTIMLGAEATTREMWNSGKQFWKAQGSWELT